MQKNIKLAIPTPCHEKWNSFAKTAQGGFCGSCQKEVIDFTGWSEEQLKTHFKKPAFNTCGRFKKEQLKVYTLEHPTASKINWLSFALISLLIAFSSRQTSANTFTKFKHHIELLLSERTIGEVVVADSEVSIVVKGKVIYARDSTTLPGVNVTCKGTNNTTVTDADGNFALTLTSSSPYETLVLDFIGLKSVEYVVNKNELNEIKIIMEEDVALLSETIVMGCLVSRPWYNPIRWWWGVKRCFRN